MPNPPEDATFCTNYSPDLSSPHKRPSTRMAVESGVVLAHLEPCLFSSTVKAALNTAATDWRDHTSALNPAVTPVRSYEQKSQNWSRPH